MSTENLQDVMKVIKDKLKDNNLLDKPIKTDEDIDNILDVLFNDIDD